MENIFDLVISNIKMVLAFMVPFLCMRFADICFGVILSFKDSNLNFDWKKLLNGVVWGVIIGIGMIMLISGIVILPELLKEYSISIIDSEALGSMVDMLSVVGIIVTSVVTYGKDAYSKFLKIFNISNTDETYKLPRQNKEGEEDVKYS